MQVTEHEDDEEVRMAERTVPDGLNGERGHRLADRGIGLLYCTDENEEGDFEGMTAAGASADLETFRQHCARTREVMAAHELGDTFAKRTNAYTLRWFYLYLIKEYARHLGHADLLRERIDGVTGE
jgi:hypothetical protein